MNTLKLWHGNTGSQDVPVQIGGFRTEAFGLVPVWTTPSLLASSLDSSHVQQHSRHSQLPLSKAHQVDDLTKAPVHGNGCLG